MAEKFPTEFESFLGSFQGIDAFSKGYDYHFSDKKFCRIGVCWN